MISINFCIDRFDNVLKQLVHASAVRMSSQSTGVVWRALKRLELLSAAPRAALTPLLCSPNFPRTQYLDIRTLTHELSLNSNIKSLSNEEKMMNSVCHHHHFCIHQT